MKKYSILLILFTSLCFTHCNQSEDKNGLEIEFSSLSGPYLGQTPPGKNASLFYPSIFQQFDGQGCSGFLNDGKVFVYKAYKKNSDWRLNPIYFTELKNGYWTQPRIAPFNNYHPYNFTIGPDGETIYFTSLKSPNKTNSMLLEEANIWAVKLEVNGWGEPVMFGKSLNTEKYYENYPAVSNNGTVYYMSRREEGIGGTDIWRSKNIDGKYGTAENLGKIINSEGGDLDPFIAPDESYLIVCQKKDKGFGGFDLYIYFKRPDNSWTEAINMGPDINSSHYEFRPSVTPDGKYLFFTSNRSEGGTIYWVDAQIIKDLKLLAIE